MVAVARYGGAERVHDKGETVAKRRMGRRRVTAAAGVVGLALAASACGDSSGDATSASAKASGEKTYTMAYAADNQKISFVAAVTKSIQAAARQRGIKLTTMDNEADSAKVIANARQAATIQPDALLEYDSNAQVNPQVAAVMKQAGVPIVAIQYPIPGAPLFAIDNRQVGRLSGEEAAKAGKARWGSGQAPAALLLSFEEGGQALIERAQGAEAGIKAVFPDATFTTNSTKNDTGTARQVMADFLTAHPHQKIIVWVHVDSMAMAALAAARAAHRDDDVVIASVGGDPSVFSEIRSPHSPFVGTVGLFPEDWGKAIVDLALDKLEGKPVAAATHPSKIVFLDRANLDKHYPGQ